MTTSRFTKVLAAAALALGVAGIAQTAHARTDVYFSVGVPAPAPVYYAPQPAPVYVAPAEAYEQPRYYDDWRWRRELRRQEFRREQWRREHWRREQWRRWHEMQREDYDSGYWR